MSDPRDVGPGHDPLLRITGLRKSFGGTEVLAGVDLEVRRGETVAVLGASGSGKSTLLRCVNALEVPDGGSVYLGDELIGFEVVGSRVRRLSERRVADQRARFGMVFQQFNLFGHWSVLDNIVRAPAAVLGLPRREASSRAMELLDRVGLADRAGAFPRQLSGGEQQRVAIARALAMRPDVLLLDEPTSALDPANVREVTDVLERLAADGTTMVVVTHQLGFARASADRVAFLHAGTVVEEGPAKRVLAAPRSRHTREFIERVLT